RWRVYMRSLAIAPRPFSISRRRSQLTPATSPRARCCRRWSPTEMAFDRMSTRGALANAVAMTVFVVAAGAAPLQDSAVNASAWAAAARSPLVKTARAAVEREANAIGDARLRQVTVDAIANAGTCIAHRRGLDAAARRAIVRQLIDGGLIAGQSVDQALA